MSERCMAGEHREAGKILIMEDRVALDATFLSRFLAHFQFRVTDTTPTHPLQRSILVYYFGGTECSCCIGCAFFYLGSLSLLDSNSFGMPPRPSRWYVQVKNARSNMFFAHVCVPWGVNAQLLAPKVGRPRYG